MAETDAVCKRKLPEFGGSAVLVDRLLPVQCGLFSTSTILSTRGM